MSSEIYAIDYIWGVCAPSPHHRYARFVPSQWRWKGVCVGQDAFGAAAVVDVFLVIALPTARMMIGKIGKMEMKDIVQKDEKARVVRVGTRLMVMLMEK